MFQTRNSEICFLSISASYLNHKVIKEYSLHKNASVLFKARCENNHTLLQDPRWSGPRGLREREHEDKTGGESEERKDGVSFPFSFLRPLPLFRIPFTSASSPLFRLFPLSESLEQAITTNTSWSLKQV